jgi:hypothetical protein
VDAPVDEHDRNFFRIPVEEVLIVEDREFLNGDGRGRRIAGQLSGHGADGLARRVTQVAARLADEGEDYR